MQIARGILGIRPGVVLCSSVKFREFKSLREFSRPRLRSSSALRDLSYLGFCFVNSFDSKANDPLVVSVSDGESFVDVCECRL